MSVDDAVLVERARRGDVAAFGELVERYRTTAFALACTRLRCRDDALDAVQDAFVQAFVRLPGLRDPARFRPWLLTIVSRRCCATLRARSRRSEIAAVVQDAAPRVPDQPSELSLLIDEALAALSSADREVFTLGVVCRLTYEEIALRTQMSVAAVRSRMYRARSRLAKELTLMSDSATTMLTRDVMRRLLVRMAEMPHPVTARMLAAAVPDREDAEVAEVTRGLASLMEQGSTLEEAVCLAHAVPPALSCLVWYGCRDGWGPDAIRAAVCVLDEGLLRPDTRLEPAAVASFCACLGALLQVGVPFAHALRQAGTIAADLGPFATQASERLEAGRMLSDVVADFPDTFAPGFCAVVRLGELMGVLDTVMTMLAGALWEPATVDASVVTGSWIEHMDAARRRIEARTAWRAQHAT